MTAKATRLLARSFVMVGLLLVLLAFAGSVSAQDMIEYPDNPIYGLSSDINATVDVYLPATARDLMSDSWMLSQDVVNMPAVFFVPALNPQTMDIYAQELTGQGYAVVAMDYRLQAAAQDSLCGLSWLHTFAPIFGIDENKIVAFGYGDGGELAALMGSMGVPNLLRIDREAQSYMTFQSGMTPAQTAGCPWPVPEGPMVEGVAAYDALLDTPVALADMAVQLSKLPPGGMDRAEMIAAFDEFATVPVTEWREYSLPETARAEVPMADILRELIPPETGVLPVEMPTAEVLREQIALEEIGRPVALTDEIMTTIVQSLPAYWLDGSEPPHLLMVGEESSPVTLADNLAYDNVLHDLNIPVQLTEMAGCGHNACDMLEHMEPLNMFLAEVFASS